MPKQRTYLNILCSVATMAVNLGISFWLSPYILRTIGVEANGFVGLANSLVTWANLLVTALNAMSTRFITIAWIRGDREQANLYYNSVFWGNLLIVAALVLPASLLVANLEAVIDIPGELISDVKWLFSLVFGLFFLRTAAPNWECATSITNRLDLVYLPEMGAALLRCGLLLGIFHLWIPRVWYVSLVSVMTGLLTLGIAARNCRRLTPGLRIRLRAPLCSRGAIRELVGSGIWSAVASGGNLLLTGLDLLVCNLYLGPTAMGILSISKTLPAILVQLSDSIRGAFGPELTICYARGDREGLYACLKRAMKITSVVVTIPAAGLVVMSGAFYALWVPTQDAKLLQILTALAVLSYLVSSGVVVLFNVFSLVNRVKYNSAAMLVSGLASLTVTVLLIHFTNWDLYAVAGVSSIAIICKNLLFTVPVASWLLGYKWNTFYPQVGVSLLCSAVVMGIGMLVRSLLPVDTWAGFFLNCGLTGILGLGANLLIVLNRQERQYLLRFLKKSKPHFRSQGPL